jgi:hypothetical protein
MLSSNGLIVFQFARSIFTYRIDSVFLQGAYIGFLAYCWWLEAQLWRNLATRHAFLVLGDRYLESWQITWDTVGGCGEISKIKL